MLSKGSIDVSRRDHKPKSVCSWIFWILKLFTYLIYLNEPGQHPEKPKLAILVPR